MQPDYGYGYESSVATAGMVGFFGFIQMLSWFWVLVFIIGLWKVFTKAGKKGWAALIPIYNVFVMLQIAEKPAWWIILLFIPFVNLVVSVLLMIEIGKKFGKGAGWSIIFLWLFGAIGVLILGFGKSQYQGKVVSSTPATAPAKTTT